jgi:hypothetical protein
MGVSQNSNPVIPLILACPTGSKEFLAQKTQEKTH